jgi:hypothetical protein
MTNEAKGQQDQAVIKDWTASVVIGIPWLIRGA